MEFEIKQNRDRRQDGGRLGGAGRRQGRACHFCRSFAVTGTCGYSSFCFLIPKGLIVFTAGSVGPRPCLALSSPVLTRTKWLIHIPEGKRGLRKETGTHRKLSVC